MTANDSLDSMRQTVWRLTKLTTSPNRRLTANGFLNPLRRMALAHVLLYMCGRLLPGFACDNYLNSVSAGGLLTIRPRFS